MSKLPRKTQLQSTMPQVNVDSKPLNGVLNLKVPLARVRGMDARVAAKTRVSHYLVQAMNALDEAAKYVAREPYLTGVTVVHALHEALRAPDGAQALKPLRAEAVSLLKPYKVEPFVASSPQELATAKASFLRLVRKTLLGTVGTRRATDGRLDWNALTTASNRINDANPAVEQASTIIMFALFFETQFAQLHEAATRADQLLVQSERFARALAYLVENGQATPVQVGRVALYVLGVHDSALKNFFSVDCIEASEKD